MAVHGALDRLQPGDLAPRGAGSPGCGGGGDHGRLVALEAANETVQQAAAGRLHPRLQGGIGAVDVGAMLAQEVHEGDGQFAGVDKVGRDTGQTSEEGLLLGFEPVTRRTEQARTAPGRRRGPRRGAAVRIRCRRTLLPAPRRPPHDGSHAAAIALGAEFTPETCAVAAAFGPAPGEIGLVRPDIAGLLGLVVRRRPAGFQPAIDREGAGSDGTADRLAGQTQPMQPDHLLIAEPTAVAPIRPQALLARSRPRQGLHRRGGFLRHGTCSLTDGTAVTIHPALQGLPEVAQQVPMIRNLHGIRCPLPHSVGIGAGAVTGDNLDPTVAPQPGRERVYLPVGQQVDDPVALQVDQDGSVVPAAPPRPIIHGQDAGRWR